MDNRYRTNLASLLAPPQPLHSDPPVLEGSYGTVSSTELQRRPGVVLHAVRVDKVTVGVTFNDEVDAFLLPKERYYALLLAAQQFEEWKDATHGTEGNTEV